MGDWAGQEKRKHKRVALHVPVECRSGQTVCTCQVENVSISGLLIRTVQPFPQDQEFTVRFSLPSGHVIEGSARVAHAVPEAFMGVEFVDLPPDSAAVIEAFVEQAPALQAGSRR
jgi:hypothetical protein